MNKSFYPFTIFSAWVRVVRLKLLPPAPSKIPASYRLIANYRRLLPKYAATITAADLSKHLHILASDEYEGRDTGEKGQKMAAAYISKEFKEDGLTGPVKTAANPYYQTFDLEKSAWGDGYIVVGSKKFTMMQDFFVVGSSPYQTEEAAEVVFAGYGIDDPKYSDYTNLDVKDKMVVVLAGEPKAATAIIW